MTIKKLKKELPNNKVLFTFKIDKKLKKEMQDFCKDIGIPFSTLVLAMIKYIVKKQSIILDPKKSVISQLEPYF